jgi:lysophospholipid hydrolase
LFPYASQFPVDVMHERMGCDTVIVVDVDDREASSALRMLAPVDGGVSGWRLLWEKANPLSRSEPPNYAALVSALTAAVAARQLAAASRAHPVHLHLRPRVAATYSVLSTADMERIVRGAYKYAFAAVVDWQMRGAGGGGAAEAPGGGMPGAPALAAAPVPGVATPPGAQQPPGGASTIGLVRGAAPVAPRAVPAAPSLPPPPAMDSSPQRPPRPAAGEDASESPALTPLRRGPPLTGARRSVSQGLAALSGASPPAVATPPAREADAAAAASTAAAVAAGAGGSPRRAPVSKSLSWNGADGGGGAADGGGVVSQLSARYAAAESSPRGSAAEAPPEVAAALQRAASAEGSPTMLRRDSSGARLRT